MLRCTSSPSFRVALLLVMLVLPLGRVVLAQDAVNRFPVYQDGAWGYIDSTGTMAIEPQFDDAAPFSDSWARVKVDGQFQFINAAGEVVLSPDVVHVGSFHQGRAVVRPETGDQLGYIDKSGRVVIAPQFEEASPFSEGRAAVSVDDDSGRSESTFGYINRDGSFVVEPQFSGARRYVEGLAPVQTGGFVHGEWGYIDEQGEMVIEPQFEEAHPFSDGLAVIVVDRIHGGWGYIDVEGRRVVEPDLDRAHRFGGGVAPVMRGAVWQYIDAEGEPAFEEDYSYAEPFHGPLARVLPEGRGESRRYTLSSSVNDANWTYINRQRQVVWPPEPSGPSDNKEQADARRVTERAPSTETPRTTEAPQSAEAPSSTETPQSTETNASIGADEEPPTKLKALLSETLPGGFVRTTVERKNLSGDNPNAAGTYASETGTLEVVVVRYRTDWNEARAKLKRAAAQQEVTETTYRSHTAYERAPEGDRRHLFVLLDPGALSVTITAPSDGPSVQRLRDALGGLDWNRLEALAQEAPKTTSSAAPSVDAPEGFSAYATDLGNVHLAFPYPKDWTVVNLHRSNKFLRGVVVMRSAEAAEKVLGDDAELSTKEKPRLVTPDNVVVTLAVMGDDLTREQYLQSVVENPPLNDPEVESPPAKANLRVSGRPARVAAVRGVDSDGRDVVQVHLAFTVDGTLISVTALHPVESPGTRKILQTLLGDLTVEVR
jgi:hypothetical protein